MSTDTPSLLDAALRYRRAGLCVLPAYVKDKRPALATWAQFQKRLPTEEEIRQWFNGTCDGICIVAGAVSSNLEVIDFDGGTKIWDAWCDIVQFEHKYLFQKGQLITEHSQSGGIHVFYRCNETIPGNSVLAKQRDGDRYRTAIETRGEGGVCLCFPSKDYRKMRGDLADVKTITSEEREILIRAARSLNEEPEKPVEKPQEAKITINDTRPGDDFARRGDIRQLLLDHGWTCVKQRSGANKNEYWRRPGKDHGWSATLNDSVFYVFSANAQPFESGRGYSFFQVYTLLAHGGDFRAAAIALAKEGYGATITQPQQQQQNATLRPVAIGDLIHQYPSLREPMIHSLLRRGEVMNVIAAPKIGKSWLVLGLGASIATGREWLGMQCTRGRVLLVDNELHMETIAHRLPKVLDAMGIDIAAISDRIMVQSMRGQLRDLVSLDSYFRQFSPGEYDLVILDAFYRFLPVGANENDNGTMASLYNCIDAYASVMGAAFVIVHHTSKGIQSLKDVTDVGAGAGAQSRAADTHCIMRQHREDDAVVLEAAPRSWPPLRPICLRWVYPVWSVDESLDPKDLRSEKGKSGSKNGHIAPADFVSRYITDAPKSRSTIESMAKNDGLSQRDIKRLLDTAVDTGLIHIWSGTYGKRYATIPEPFGGDDGSSDRQRVLAAIAENPTATSTEIAAAVGVNDRYVRKIRKSL